MMLKKGFDYEKPDLIVLDVMMEGKDGFQFCREIRSEEKLKLIPVIFRSAKSEEFDKVLGLELGGDDYLTKPFSIKELRSRIKAILRRTEITPENKKPSAFLKYKGVELNPGNFFSRDNIINSVRGHDVFVVDRTIDVHIMNLRKKLGQYKNIITTFSGVGYGFKE